MSTTVPDKKLNNNPAPYCGEANATEKGVTIPPKTARVGVDVEKVKDEATKGEDVIIQAYNGRLNENNILIGENGETIQFGQKAYKNTLNASKNRKRGTSKEVGNEK